MLQFHITLKLLNYLHKVVHWFILIFHKQIIQNLQSVKIFQVNL